MAEALAATRITRSSAIIDGEYRYELTRTWGAPPDVLWIMLNPSTADAELDDPTIRRVMGFSKAWGYGGVVVVNLFALRATNPKALLVHSDPVGPKNDRVMRSNAGLPWVAAWGAHPAAQERVEWLIRQGWCPRMTCLGTTRTGAPKHPLYVPKSAERRTWMAQKENSTRG